VTNGEDEHLEWLDRSPEEVAEERRRRRERRELHRAKVRRKRRRKRAAIIALVVITVFLVLSVLWFWWVFGGLQRMPVAVGSAGADTPGTTILLVGSDPAESAASRDGEADWRHDLRDDELVMLLHITRDKRAMFVISMPSDSILDIPGLGPGKLADAAAAGGPQLVARTIETMSGVRLDRMAVMDLNAFREITHELGGVTVEAPRDACGLAAGPQRLDSQATLDYIALQPCMPRKDLDRVERQQSLVKGLMRGAVDGGKLTHPLAVNGLLRATTSHLAVEDNFSYPSMLGMLWSMRHLRTTNTTFLTVPVAADPLVSVRGVDYVQLDAQRDAVLWTALRADQLAEYVSLTGPAS
jgi:LCP family protein required for cell wall assembly